MKRCNVMGMADPNGPMIEAIRKRLGLRRSELADRVDCSYQHIYNVERGFNRAASDELLQRIADVFHVELDVISRKPSEPSPTPRPAPTSRPAPSTPVPPPRPTKPPTRVAVEGAVA